MKIGIKQEFQNIYLKKTKNYNFIVEDSFSKGWQIAKRLLGIL